MKNQEKPHLKLPIQQELAYEVISISIIVIFFGLAFLFATNLLSFNWYSIFFALLFVFGVYVKYSSYLVIKNNQITIRYYKYLKLIYLEISQIDEMTFHQKKRQVQIKDYNGTITLIYLNRKNKEKLLNYIVQYYPKIDCLFI